MIAFGLLGTRQSAAGRWDFRCDKVLDLAEKHHLKVLASSWSMLPRIGLSWSHPETRFVERMGIRLSSGPKANQRSAVPGTCFHNAAARQRRGIHAQNCVPFRGAHHLVAYDVWNEVELVECWCQGSQAVYRQYCKPLSGMMI